MIQLSNAKKYLVKLNAQLNTKCNKNYKMVFESYAQILKKDPDAAIYSAEHGTFDAVLCLMYMNHCISSIACNIHKNGTMEISSKTMPEHEGKKYNLLLRAACFLIAPHIDYINHRQTHNRQTQYRQTQYRQTQKKSSSLIKSVNKIVSRAVNPLSTYTLHKYFNASNKKLATYLKSVTEEDATVDNIKSFHESLMPSDMSEDAELEYLKNNPDATNPVLLTINLKSPPTMRKIQKTFDETIERILC